MLKEATTQWVWSQKGYHNLKISWKSRGKSSNKCDNFKQTGYDEGCKTTDGLHR